MDRLRGGRAPGERDAVPADHRAPVLPGTDRRTPALTLERDGQPPVADLFMTIVTNRSPWTYFRGRALLPVPNPDFNSGLDVLALRGCGSRPSSARWARCYGSGAAAARAQSAVGARPESFTVRSARPIAFQVDGEYLGETEAVKFQFVPHAIRVVA